MVTGLVVDANGFELVVDGRRVGPRRMLQTFDVELLDAVAGQYVDAVRNGSKDQALLAVGRELYRWLDGDLGQLTRLLDEASAPLVFEVRAPTRPSAAAWALLRAPYELLATPASGFLAAEAPKLFAVARRLGHPSPAQALDGYRLGVAFMASAPRGQHELDFEAEEMAILNAVGETSLDLVVEDSGNPEHLGLRLSELGGMPVVHLSCHGLHNWRPGPDKPATPVLLMEDDLGDGRPTSADALVGLLTPRPRLAFVSACLTATGADVAGHVPAGAGHRGGPTVEPAMSIVHSMATGLVAAGIPAVIGWDGSVSDQAATRFAERLYSQLGRRVGVAVAVAEARRHLLACSDERQRAEWHLARLWLGPTGGGPLVAGIRKRQMVPPHHVTKTFLDRKRQLPVAAAEMFVGRRPEMQRTLRALRGGQKAGVLLHGQGRLGKSSLAARIADRHPNRAVAVVFGDYTPTAILDAIADAVATNADARTLIEARRVEVRDQPDRLKPLLIDLLAGPCAQELDDVRKPLLLIIDDLEQILTANPDGPHRLDLEHATVLADVLCAFDPAITDSRLLVTSRYTFTLDGLEARLEPVQLQPLSPAAQRKLQRRQQDLAPAEYRTQRADLAQRALDVSCGNPGLQDLIGLRLVYSSQVDQARAEAAVVGMEAYLQQGDLPTGNSDIGEFLEKLALDTLLDQAGSAHRDLLRACTLFTVPVPQPVIEALAAAVGGSASRLCGLGLLDAFPDQHRPDIPALAVNALAAGRLTPLTPDEQVALAALAAEPLYLQWGGATRRPARGSDLDLQLTHLALAADNPTITADCAAEAVYALRQGPASTAAELGHHAITLLDRHNHEVPVTLLRAVADAAVTSGDGDHADTLLHRAVQQNQTSDRQTNPADHAAVLYDHANRLITRGETDQAEDLLHQARQLFTDADDTRSVAITWGQIADIYEQRGEVDEALRIHREVELPVYERIGDTHSAAVTWSQIADTFEQRGEVDEALRIRREVTLPAFERIGDAREVAVTWGKIADIFQQRGEVDEALRIRREVELPVYERIGDTRSAAVTWGQIADILQRHGEVDEALRIRREVTLPAYERIGDTRSVAVTWGKIADIIQQRGEVDEALRIRREVELPAFERIGDTRLVAVTWGKIAYIFQQRGEVDEALRIRREVTLPVFERIGDTRSVAVTWGQIADIYEQRGEVDEALRIRREVTLPAYERIGDTRSVAVTWGKIADIIQQRGEVDEALRIRREVELPAFERIGDTRLVAVTWGKIAYIFQQRGEVDEALRIRREVTLPVFERIGDTRSVAVTWGQIADIYEQRGEVDEALRIRREVTLPAYERIGDTRSVAVTWGKIADIFQQRGEVDEALRIRREVELPVYERIGDTRALAVTWSQIADILQRHGEVDEALRIRREVELPVYERIGDTRLVAVTWGKIAYIYEQRGEVDEALRIRREVTLPVFERIGDTRSVAVTWGKIADIIQQRGEVDEALRIRREVELPVYERIGDTRALAVTWSQIADILQRHGEVDEALRIRREVELPVYERIGDTRLVAVTWGKIAYIYEQRGEVDEALRIRREVTLPVFERIGDTRSVAVTWGKIADIIQQRGEVDEALRIRREVELPVYERIGDTRALAVTWGQIADIYEQRGKADEALELQLKRLQVSEQLGDMDGIAAANWDLARIDLNRQDRDAAVPRLVISFQLLLKLQRPDGLAVVGTVLGQLLLAADERVQARQVFQTSRAAAAEIGLSDVVDQLDELLNAINDGNEEL
ncbi:CHAT domain-containing protein [Streptomyces adustus]|uniref:CHAT domain-containing protein n=1 Tax=Streptomyces adustus TaxID=1609272 RepID=A0A5N8VGT0_9ACTN|nr:CHAT domain-containing protein [Streptomyces adustus]MPY34371.1 CHAT domain-containing protein [Streptomyces adustus]